jgi:hypothetical protein
VFSTHQKNSRFLCPKIRKENREQHQFVFPFNFQIYLLTFSLEEYATTQIQSLQATTQENIQGALLDDMYDIEGKKRRQVIDDH